MKRISALAYAAALLIGGAAAAADEANPKPQRVMSLNLCTDQLVLQLLPVERIGSVTYLSRMSGYSFLAAETFGVPVNYGTPEEVLRENPDLVIAGDASTPGVRALLTRVGVPLVEVPAAANFDDIRDSVRLVADAVGEHDKGESLIAQMDATLAGLAATAPARRIVVAGWDGAGNVHALGTLFDAILTAAGAENVAARLTRNVVYGRYTGFDLEQLVALRPDILAYGNARAGRLDLSNEQLQHRVVRRLYASRRIAYPEILYSCGLPQSADAARDLRRALLDAMDGGEPVPRTR